MHVVGSGEVERFFFFLEEGFRTQKHPFPVRAVGTLSFFTARSKDALVSKFLDCLVTLLPYSKCRTRLYLAHLSDALPPATCPQFPLPCLDRGFCPELHLSPHLFPVCFISVLPLCGNFDPNPTETICSFQKIHTPLSHSSVP